MDSAHFEDCTRSIITEHAMVIEQLKGHMSVLHSVCSCIVECITRGGKILFMGNGGSAADAQHLAAEFVGRFKMNRRALPAIALTTDTSILTAVANDFGYEHVFSRQILALARKGDVVVGISTSGKSPNVLRGLEVATGLNCWTVFLCGEACGTSVDFRFPFYGSTARIQEAHILTGHIICELVESMLTAHGGVW